VAPFAEREPEEGMEGSDHRERENRRMEKDLTWQDVPQLSDSYQGAHKAYGLCSALLIAWEFIGIEFDASPIESLRLTLKSPQAVPYVLIVLVAYFAFRLTIEWFQTDRRRRSMTPSRIDFGVAHLIGTLSLALYGYQALSQVQLANLLSPEAVSGFIMGSIAGFAIIQTPALIIIWLMMRSREDFYIFFLFSVPVFGVGIFLMSRVRSAGLLEGALVGFIPAAILTILLFLWMIRKEQQQLKMANQAPAADS
jgi:hypothetical protein